MKMSRRRVLQLAGAGKSASKPVSDIYRNLYITHRPSTGITMLYVTVTVLMFAMKAYVSEKSLK